MLINPPVSGQWPGNVPPLPRETLTKSTTQFIRLVTRTVRTPILGVQYSIPGIYTSLPLIVVHLKSLGQFRSPLVHNRARVPSGFRKDTCALDISLIVLHLYSNVSSTTNDIYLFLLPAQGHCRFKFAAQDVDSQVNSIFSFVLCSLCQYYSEKRVS